MLMDEVRLSLIISIIVLNACASVPRAPPKCGPPLTQQQIDDVAKTYLALIDWKDPDSVQVRNARMTGCRTIPHGLLVKEAIPAGWEVVLEVNAKNSYGGYTGFESKSIIYTTDGKIHY